MTELFKRLAGPPPPRAVPLPVSQQMRAADPKSYIADAGLVDAVNTALLLNQPLLLTGEPGTGKTQLAPALAYQLGLPWHRFQAKSNSQARELFYTYDAVGHFRAGESARRLDFVRFEALGQALIDAMPWSRVANLYSKPVAERLAEREPSASVVLIDEVDKAPRDFPNDLLAELEEMHLRLPELDIDLPAPQTLRPVVVITSNSERDLPDAFLRRCVYYDIPFPERDTLREILASRLKAANGVRVADEFLDSALSLFATLREVPGLRKKPATAELIGFMLALSRSRQGTANPLADPSVALRNLGVLLKNPEDLELAKQTLKNAPRGDA